MPSELPTHHRAERRDKSRNRARVLAAAADLFTHEGVERVTVDDIAAKAGVGVGTLYRGFGDKGGLVAAILDERERELQDKLLSGPPPLGPGAPPQDRIRAFLDALSRLVERSYELLVVSENSVPGARYRIGSYGAWRLHLATLLSEIEPDEGADRGLLAGADRGPLAGADRGLLAGADRGPLARADGGQLADTDAGLLADALLAPLASDLYRHQRREQGASAKRIRAALIQLADGLIGPP